MSWTSGATVIGQGTPGTLARWTGSGMTLTNSHVTDSGTQVKQVFPWWVDTGADGYKRLTFRGFEAVAVEAVRELDAKSNDATARITELERQNADLRHAVEVLSNAVKALQQK